MSPSNPQEVGSSSAIPPRTSTTSATSSMINSHSTPDQLRSEASKQMAIRHASAVAAASIEKKLATSSSTSETVKLTRQLTELQKCSLQSELAFLDCLGHMSNEARLQSLFLLFDQDGSGSVSSHEMARCLRKMDAGKSATESLDAAILSMQTFDSDGDGMMDVLEFADFVEHLVDSLQCDFEDLAQFLALRVAFAESGSGVLDEAIIALVEDSEAQQAAAAAALRHGEGGGGDGELGGAGHAAGGGGTTATSVESFNDAVVEVRMMLLFQMMMMMSSTAMTAAAAAASPSSPDGGGGGMGDDAGGAVLFEDVVKALYHVTMHMDEIPRKALLMCSDGMSSSSSASSASASSSEQRRILDYPQFSSLLLNVVAAGSLNFHDVANAMTLSVCKNDVTRSELSDLFVGDEITRIAGGDGGTIAVGPDSSEILDALQYGRLNRLFDLWDLDHSDSLDFSELVLGMRKFHQAKKDVDQTLEEGVAALLAFDENEDQKLDRKEFATLLAKFAKAAHVPLHELIDFMVVTSAVKDNSNVERAYIESVKMRAQDQLREKQQQQPHRSSATGASTSPDGGGRSSSSSATRSIGSLWSGLLRGGGGASSAPAGSSSSAAGQTSASE